MEKYKIGTIEGLKLMTDCSYWFKDTTDLFLIIKWVASRCNAPTLSANVKMEAAVEFLTTYFDLNNGIKI